MSRVAIYARVSTDQQTTANQIDELKAWAPDLAPTGVPDLS